MTTFCTVQQGRDDLVCLISIYLQNFSVTCRVYGLIPTIHTWVDFTNFSFYVVWKANYLVINYLPWYHYYLLSLLFCINQNYDSYAALTFTKTVVLISRYHLDESKMKFLRYNSLTTGRDRLRLTALTTNHHGGGANREFWKTLVYTSDAHVRWNPCDRWSFSYHDGISFDSEELS